MKITCDNDTGKYYRIILGRQGRMELKRRFKDHPKRFTLNTSKPISYWNTKECLDNADTIGINYNDLIKKKLIEKVKQIPKESLSTPTNSKKIQEEKEKEKERKKTLTMSFPFSYKISVLLTGGSRIKIELVNSTLVSELKHYLHSVFHQVNKEEQKLLFKGIVLDDDKRLFEYFNYDLFIDLKLYKLYTIYYKTCDGYSGEIKIFNDETPSSLLSIICAKENWVTSTKELSHEGLFIEGFIGTLESLGITNKSLIYVNDISEFCFNMENTITTLLEI